MPASLELISQHRCFGGSQRYYRHESAEIGLPMRFSVFVPPQAEHGPVPVSYTHLDVYKRQGGHGGWRGGAMPHLTQGEMSVG